MPDPKARFGDGGDRPHAPVTDGAQCWRQDISEVHSGAVGWLSLAAAPTFVIIALTTGILGDGPGFMICPADDASLPDGVLRRKKAVKHR